MTVIQIAKWGVHQLQSEELCVSVIAIHLIKMVIRLRDPIAAGRINIEDNYFANSAEREESIRM
jgi:hypothetical protein